MSETAGTRVEIYTWRACPFCIHAKRLLSARGVRFVEYPIDGDAAARAAMRDRAGGRDTLPQIFIDDQPIGGCDELVSLDRSGDLETWLGAQE